MAGIEPMPEGVGVAGLAASFSPGADSAFVGFGAPWRRNSRWRLDAASARRQRRENGQTRAGLWEKGRESGEHGRGAKSSRQKAVSRKQKAESKKQ